MLEGMQRLGLLARSFKIYDNSRAPYPAMRECFAGKSLEGG